jgi:hypothetical protein
MSLSQPVNNQSSFLPTTTVLPKDMDELLIRLTKNYNDIANYLNIREIAIYETTEILTGEQWTNPGQPTNRRQTFRKIFYFGAIAAGANLVIPTGISSVTSYTHIYGTANTDGPDSRSIPFVDVTNVTNQISVIINNAAASATVFNGATAPNITNGILILEYLKS